MKLATESKRPYRQTARAAAAEANAERIVDVFRARLERMWFDEIRLEEVAADAGVTVQTVIRRFGGKDGLLEAATERMAVDIKSGRGLPIGEPAAIIGAVVADYETVGDLIMRMLAQEDRHAPLRRQCDRGRVEHREWLATVCAPWLDGLPPEKARQRLDALVVATDLYVWKLIRRDMRRPIHELQALMERLFHAALAE